MAILGLEWNRPIVLLIGAGFDRSQQLLLNRCPPAEFSTGPKLSEPDFRLFHARTYAVEARAKWRLCVR